MSCESRQSQSRLKPNQRAFENAAKESHHIVVAHPYAAVRSRLADEILMVGAVDVDVAGKCIDIAALIDPRLKSFQPEDAGEDQIALPIADCRLPIWISFGFRISDFGFPHRGGLPFLENRPQRLGAPHFFSDGM